VVAQPITMPVVGLHAGTAAENAVAVWAVLDVLDSVPAAPETQQAFGAARARVQRRSEAVGIDTNQIDLAFASADLPSFESRGDPPIS
jgi:hypothetical protein